MKGYIQTYIYIYIYMHAYIAFEVGSCYIEDSHSLNSFRLHLRYLISYPFRIEYIKRRHIRFANKE